MKKILPLLLVLASSLSFAQGSWSDAVYGVLSGSGTGQRTMYYYDSFGSLLGSQLLDDSAYAGADSIAYGNSAGPGLAAGVNGLAFMATEVGAATATTASAARQVKFYSDPLLSSAASLARISATDYTFAGPGLTVPAVDHYMDIDITSNGRIMALVVRKNESTGAVSGTYLYIFNVAGAATTGSAVSIGRENSTTFNQLWTLSGTTDAIAFTFGSAFLTTAQTYDEQIIYVGADGLLQARLGTYNTVGNGSQATASVTGYTPFSVNQDGKTIVSLWEADNSNLGVLYSDGTAIEWNMNTQTQERTFSFDGLSNPLDIVQFKPAVVPEPSTYAAILGGVVLLFALRCRKSKK